MNEEKDRRVNKEVEGEQFFTTPSKDRDANILSCVFQGDDNDERTVQA
jgi:hypothetical protein